MGKAFESAHGFGLVVRGQEREGGTGGCDQTGLAGDAEFFFVGGRDCADGVEQDFILETHNVTQIHLVIL